MRCEGWRERHERELGQWVAGWERDTKREKRLHARQRGREVFVRLVEMDRVRLEIKCGMQTWRTASLLVGRKEQRSDKERRR